MDKRTLRNGLLLACLSLMGTPAWATDLTHVSSPDGQVEVRVFTEDNQLYCEATREGNRLLKPSSLGLVVDGVDLGKDVSLVSHPKVESIDETYPLNGNHPTVRNHCLESALTLRASGKEYVLFVRAYDDGMAIRYALPEGTERVDKEPFAMPCPRGRSG